MDETCVLAPVGRYGKTHTTFDFDSFGSTEDIDVVSMTNQVQICKSANNQAGFLYQCVDGVWSRDPSKKANGLCATDALYAVAKANALCSAPANMPEPCRGDDLVLVDSANNVRRFLPRGLSSPTSCSNEMPMTVAPELGRCAQATPELMSELSQKEKVSVQLDSFCTRMEEWKDVRPSAFGNDFGAGAPAGAAGAAPLPRLPLLRLPLLRLPASAAPLRSAFLRLRLCGSRFCGSRFCGSRFCGSRFCGSRSCARARHHAGRPRSVRTGAAGGRGERRGRVRSGDSLCVRGQRDVGFEAAADARSARRDSTLATVSAVQMGRSRQGESQLRHRRDLPSWRSVRGGDEYLQRLGGPLRRSVGRQHHFCRGHFEQRRISVHAQRSRRYHVPRLGRPKVEAGETEHRETERSSGGCDAAERED